jgi:murein DD-endopeptidase MepM/ murein hydrolase activator NlpD
MIAIRFVTCIGLFFLLLASLVLLPSCDSKGTDPKEAQQPLDLAGDWQLTTTIASNTCGLPNGTQETETIVLAESNGGFSITTFSGPWGTVQVSGQNVSISGSERSDELGHPATLETDGTGTATEFEMVGTFATAVTFDPGGSQSDCEISNDFVMAKMDPSPCLDRATFGDPQDSEYILPYPVGASYEVYQSYCDPTAGHRNQLAYDFIIPIGDTVVAARGGVVRQIREDSPDDGQGYGEHNLVFIEHPDGTAGFYAHLMQNSVAVEPGDTVETGQYIAQSGNSGDIDDPHLHFGVYEEYPATEGVDLPVNFRNADGPLDSRGGLIRGEFYTALSY